MDKSNKNERTEEVIKELKGLVIDVNYNEPIRTSRPKKLDKTLLWEKAKKVGKHLNDDSLSSPLPARS